jgi:serine/threonine-protein kinase
LFRRKNQGATVKAVLDDPIVRPSQVEPEFPVALERVCMKALRRDRDARYATALDMRRALLEAIQEGGPAMPEEDLARRMHTLFADRIVEKEQMLRRLQDGHTPTHVPCADVDETVELPSVDVELARNAEKPESGRRFWVWPAALASVALAIFGAYHLGTATTTATPAVVGAASDAETPAAPATMATELPEEDVVEETPTDPELQATDTENEAEPAAEPVPTPMRRRIRPRMRRRVTEMEASAMTPTPETPPLSSMEVDDRPADGSERGWHRLN